MEMPLPSSILNVFLKSAKKLGDKPHLHYYGRAFSFKEVDVLSTNLATFLASQVKIKQGDRVALCLQNIPQFIIIVLATWKLGAIVVPVSPMSKEKEMEYTLKDSGARVVFSLKGELQNIIYNVWPNLPELSTIIVTSPLDFLPPDATKQYPELAHMIEKTIVCESIPLVPYANHKPSIPFKETLIRRPHVHFPKVKIRPSDISLLTYTSGTTGPSKGAMNTHGNVVFNTNTWYKGLSLAPPNDVILGVAPLFHITGLSAHVALSLTGVPLVLTWQFHPSLVARLAENYKCTFLVGASTAFTALLHDPYAKTANLSSIKKCYSGGAPVSPTLIESMEKTYGINLHVAYGMTETTAPTHLTPLGTKSPIDPATLAASIGFTVEGAYSTIVDEDRKELPVGEIGEITVRGPMVVPGYWRKDEETKKAFGPDGTIYTGDVGYRDEKGYFYLVDRKKDMIIASGFKVWPREVEDVIYKHPKVKEVAVIGVPDEYRGETVKAFVSVKDGETLTSKEVIEYCKSRMAAYKYPREVEIIADVPKNVNGKIMRRNLRPTLQAKL